MAFIGQNEELPAYPEKRLAICKECPLYKKTIMGPVCNSRLWLDVNTGDISFFKKDGYKNGCGCMLNKKVQNISAACPLDKW